MHSNIQHCYKLPKREKIHGIVQIYFAHQFSWCRLGWCCGAWDLRIRPPSMLPPVKYTMLKNIWLIFDSCFHFYKQRKHSLHLRSLHISRYIPSFSYLISDRNEDSFTVSHTKHQECLFNLRVKIAWDCFSYLRDALRSVAIFTFYSLSYDIQGHSSRLAALDYTICLQSEAFVTTQGSNFPHFLMGHRRYLYGGHAKTIKPDKRKMVLLFDNPDIRSDLSYLCPLCWAQLELNLLRQILISQFI